MIFKWFVFEKYHYALIARKLDEMGVPKGIASKTINKGTKWQQGTIKSMLKNTSYVGIRIEKLKDDDGEVEEIEVKVPSIIDEDIFDFAQVRIEEIENDEKGKNNGGGKNEYLLSRKIVDMDTKV